MTLLALDEIGFRYASARGKKREPPKAALEGVSLEVREGEIYGLLGPNGSGKSTLLKLLAGALRWQRGALRFVGEVQRPASTAWRHAVSVVFQSPALDGVLTARENLRLGAALYGQSPSAAAVEEALAAVGMARHADERVATMSGGMKRRVDIARALLPQPRLLLLDEPTAGLDEASFRAMWAHLEAVRAARGLTIVVATHRPDEAERCDRLAVLSEGALVRVGSPEELRAELAEDVMRIELHAGVDAERARAAVERSLAGGAGEARESIEVQAMGQRIEVTCADAPSRVPGAYEALRDACGQGAVASLQVRRADLADAFVRMTGRSLVEAPEGAA